MDRIPDYRFDLSACAVINRMCDERTRRRLRGGEPTDDLLERMASILDAAHGRVALAANHPAASAPALFRLFRSTNSRRAALAAKQDFFSTSSIYRREPDRDLLIRLSFQSVEVSKAFSLSPSA
jgi:hypothetical protein